MATAEIKSTDWKTFCEKFLQLHRGDLMSIVKIEPSGQKVDAVRDMPLSNIWFENGACNDTIFFNFEQQGKRETIHQIIDPIHIKIREESEGQKGLQIDAENGSTLLLFSSGKLPELLTRLQIL